MNRSDLPEARNDLHRYSSGQQILIFTKNMQLSFTYDKKKVLQALRYHFIWQPEIRILLILVIVFDIATAVLYMMGKIRPEPFLLGSFIWLLFIIAFWFILPTSIYKKAETFKDKLSIDVGDRGYYANKSKRLCRVEMGTVYAFF